MREVDIAIIGGGPAVLMAADAAATNGASVLLLERDGHLGGQLVKHTHKFLDLRNSMLLSAALRLPQFWKKNCKE